MSDVSERNLRIGWILGGVLAALLAGLLLVRWGTDFYVDLLWFQEVGYTEAFWTRALADWGMRILVVVVTGALTYLNLRLAASSLGRIQVRRKFGDLEIQEQIPERYLRWGVAAISVMVALWFAAAVTDGAGVRLLLLFQAPGWGIAEPIFGRDAGFFVYWLPALSAVVTFGLVLGFFLFALSAVGYAATGAIRWGESKLRVERLPRIHLGALGAGFLALLAARFWLGRYLLLLDGNSGVQGIFGYADDVARTAAYQALAGLILLAAGAILWGAIRRVTPAIIGGVAAAIVGTLALVEAYPALVQRFQVQPNELAREGEYIEHAVDYTRQGFGLEAMERQNLGYRPPTGEDWDAAEGQLDGLPIWSRPTLLSTYRQIEARFEYYDFNDIALDRYPADDGDGVVPVSISVREVDPDGIPNPTWQNLHLRERYVTGHGAVAGAAHRLDGDGRAPMFLTGIPPRFDEGSGAPQELRLDRPSIFVGSRPQRYSILNPSEEEFLAPDGAPGEPGVDYPEGIPLSSFFRTLAFAWQFGDANIVLAQEVQASSHFVFRRDATERVHAVAPFLEYMENPYPVVHDGRLVWIVEGFTAARHFPLSQAHEIPGSPRPVNWVRNSVKATVDAVSGDVDIYVVDEEDPLLEGYRSVFPSVFQDLEEMPAGLREHLRYPRELLELQAGVLTRFHQSDPRTFHRQEDRWQRAQQYTVQQQEVMYQAEYGVWRLPGEEDPDFHLATVFVPAGRQNLASQLVARWNEDTGPEVHLYDVAVEHQFRGPRQIEALIEQDPFISQQFSLWRQGGSEVWTGHLHLVPIGSSLLWMEPVFLAADQDAIPEIRRFIVSDGRRVAMEEDLEDALTAVREGLVAEVGDVEDPEGELDPPADPDADPGAQPPAQAPGVPGAAPTPAVGGAHWQQALQHLEQAEERLQQGDWSGFGTALEELRATLEEMAGDDGVDASDGAEPEEDVDAGSGEGGGRAPPPPDG